jgi:hypothetical protein
MDYPHHRLTLKVHLLAVAERIPAFGAPRAGRVEVSIISSLPDKIKKKKMGQNYKTSSTTVCKKTSRTVHYFELSSSFFFLSAMCSR